MDARSSQRWMAPLLVAITLLCPRAAAAEPLPTRPDAGMPVIGMPDGYSTGSSYGYTYAHHSVNAMARDGETLYVAGEFSYVGPFTGPLARVDSQGRPDLDFPRVSSSQVGGDAEVAAIEPDGAGGWYVGGSFTDVGHEQHANLAHIRADGTVDAAFDPAPDGGVTGLVLTGGRLVVAGGFAHVGGAARAGLAALDPVTGAATGWAPEPDGGARALLEHEGTLFVGGDFTHVAGAARAHLAAFRDGALTAFAPPVDGAVTALTAGSDRLYVSGDFTAPRAHLAAFRLDGSADSAWQPVAQGSARQLLFVAPGRVYVMSRSAQHFERGFAYGAVVDAGPGAGTYDDTFLWGPASRRSTAHAC